MVNFTIMAFLGMLIASGFCLKGTEDSADTGNVVIPSNQQNFTSTSLLENLVEAKCQLYTAGLQDKVNELKAKVDRLEINNSDQNLKNKDYSLAKNMKKRAIPKALQAICTTSSSLCTHYHPDHPDASNKNGKYSPTVTNEMLNNIKVKGIPTSCKDLQQIGHSLNGLYLIKKSLPNNQGTKIQTVFCDFQSTTSSNGSQEIIGDVDVKTKRVHFYVQRNSDFSTNDAVIPFELERLNEGNAFNLKSGIFTAPVPGIYHFQFSAQKDGSTGDCWNIYFQVNGSNIGIVGTSITADYESSSLTASLRLKAKDKVNLYKNSIGGSAVYENTDGHHTHFTGWLVDEDF